MSIAPASETERTSNNEDLPRLFPRRLMLEYIPEARRANLESEHGEIVFLAEPLLLLHRCHRRCGHLDLHFVTMPFAVNDEAVLVIGFFSRGSHDPISEILDGFIMGLEPIRDEFFFIRVRDLPD